MPSVREKACQYSKQGQRRIYKFQSSRLLKNANTLTKWLHPPRRLEILLKNRLGYRQSDMPKVGEEQVSKTNKQSSPGSKKRQASEKLLKKSSVGPPSPTRSSRDAEESGQNRTGSSTSSKRGQAKPPHKGHHSQVANDCAKILNVPLPLGQSRQAADSIDKRTAPSAADLSHHLDQQLRRRKKQIVDTLMAAILECLDKKLEALEEACDLEGSNSKSQASSGGFRLGNQKPQTAGQKRQLHRDDQDDSSNEDGSGGSDRTKKRARVLNEDSLPKYACPYYKYAPERFKNHRTCCGPGWAEVHRVKEHLKRSHSLPKFECNRCCRLFKEEEELKAHQRKAKPCPVQDPASVPRDLADGFNQDQDQKLQKRIKKASEEKWKEWYCILFNLEPNSTEIPSPYHDIPNGPHRPSGSSGDSSFQNYCEYYREKLTPLIHRHVEQEVEKAILDVEDRVKSNVMNRIKGLPAMLHRLIQSIPPPGEDSKGEFHEFQVPDNFNPDQFLEDLDFDDTDGFDFEGMNNDAVVCFESTESSGISSFSGSYYPMPSSNTSVDDELQAQYYLSKTSGATFQQTPVLPDYTYPAGNYL